jgi:hypothetical protein
MQNETSPRQNPQHPIQSPSRSDNFYQSYQGPQTIYAANPSPLIGYIYQDQPEHATEPNVLQNPGNISLIG